MKRTYAAATCLLFFVALSRLAAAPQGVAEGSQRTGGEATEFDPARYIGLDLKTALETLGTPQEVFSFRGPEESQDNVVFYYPDFLYLFWYRNRVWQVRCDRRFARPLFGVAMGMPREVIERTSQHQLLAKGDSLYFDLDDGKYPLRVRLVFSDSALSDLYVYRSDF
jgi:hypothetical protein